MMNIRKICTAVLIAAALCFQSSAEIMKTRYTVTKSEKEFDVLYYATPSMKIIESKENDDVNITQSFTVNKNNVEGEIRYSLFTDNGGSEDTLKMDYAMWVFMCANNSAGYEVSPGAFSNFNDEDVKKEFNGDFGCTAFIQNPVSEYGNGWKNMMMEFFCKKGQGIVMRVFLFNSTDFVGINKDGSLSADSPLFSNYHTFKFMEKDENGDYIK